MFNIICVFQYNWMCNFFGWNKICFVLYQCNIPIFLSGYIRRNIYFTFLRILDTVLIIQRWIFFFFYPIIIWEGHKCTSNFARTRIKEQRFSWRLYQFWIIFWIFYYVPSWKEGTLPGNLKNITLYLSIFNIFAKAHFNDFKSYQTYP